MTTTTKHTELSLRTAFILNPVKLLDEIGNAIKNEEKEESQQLLSLIVKHDYINLIAGLITNQETTNEVRHAALWTTGLLLVSDDEAIRRTSFAAVSPLIGQIFALMFTKSRNSESAAYLILSFARSITQFGDEAVQKQFAEYLLGPVSHLSEYAQNDYFATLFQVFENYSAPPTALVAAYLNSPVEALSPNIIQGTFTRCLGMLCERNRFIRPDTYPDAFHLFEKLPNNWNYNTELLWVLSNLLCEPGAADCLAELTARGESHLLNDIDSDTDDPIITKNAIWAIANFIVNLQNPNNQLFLVEHMYWLKTILERFADKKVAAEGLRRFNELDAQFFPEDSDSDSDASSETTEVYNDGCRTNVPELLVVETAAVSTPPSALQLVVGQLPSPSETVRRLVTELMAAGIYSWVAVPDNAMFSAADMRWMEGSGYVVSQGHFGISPWLRWG